MAIDEGKINAFVGQFVSDFGAVMPAAAVVGDQFGLYKALTKGPATAAELASRPHTDPRYLREWLSAQAASAYVRYKPESERFSLTEEQVFALADEGRPAFIPGAFRRAFCQRQARRQPDPDGPGLFSASTFICTPASRSQEVGLCLAAQASEARLRDVVTQGGFRHFRRASQTPFNLFFEARP